MSTVFIREKWSIEYPAVVSVFPAISTSTALYVRIAVAIIRLKDGDAFYLS